MPNDSKAGNEQVSVGKMQIKGATHGSPPPGICHTEFSVENEYVYLPGHKGPP